MLPALLLLYYAMRRLRGIVEMLVETHIADRAEREQRATMVATAQSLPEGGAAARFDRGRPSWLFRKDPAEAAGPRAVATREAA
ncbi:hypothetical protein [Streptomyces qinglanensis]|uniref:hypothetical protein n=1 Tax=Streptomyces qinglanensis TaxID=943816 RepID=UPI003D70FDF6